MGIFNVYYKFESILRISIISLILLSSNYEIKAQAQDLGDISPTPTKDKKKGFDASRLVVGGILGAQFGSATFIEVSPNIGYMFTDNFLAGIGLRYQYFEQDFQFYKYKSNTYGGGVFGQYYFLENFIAHLEYELLNLNDLNNPEERANVTSIFVGGGYRSMMGSRSFFSILLLYNLNETFNTPYTNPIIRIGFGLGL